MANPFAGMFSSAEEYQKQQGKGQRGQRGRGPRQEPRREDDSALSVSFQSYDEQQVAEEAARNVAAAREAEEQKRAQARREAEEAERQRQEAAEAEKRRQAERRAAMEAEAAENARKAKEAEEAQRAEQIKKAREAAEALQAQQSDQSATVQSQAKPEVPTQKGWRGPVPVAYGKMEFMFIVPGPNGQDRQLTIDQYFTEFWNPDQPATVEDLKRVNHCLFWVTDDGKGGIPAKGEIDDRVSREIWRQIGKVVNYLTITGNPYPGQFPNKPVQSDTQKIQVHQRTDEQAEAAKKAEAARKAAEEAKRAEAAKKAAETKAAEEARLAAEQQTQATPPAAVSARRRRASW